MSSRVDVNERQRQSSFRNSAVLEVLLFKLARSTLLSSKGNENRFWSSREPFHDYWHMRICCWLEFNMLGVKVTAWASHSIENAFQRCCFHLTTSTLLSSKGNDNHFDHSRNAFLYYSHIENLMFDRVSHSCQESSVRCICSCWPSFLEMRLLLVFGTTLLSSHCRSDVKC